MNQTHPKLRIVSYGLISTSLYKELLDNPKYVIHTALFFLDFFFFVLLRNNSYKINF
jgi:hypothetical protein